MLWSKIICHSINYRQPDADICVNIVAKIYLQLDFMTEKPENKNVSEKTSATSLTGGLISINDLKDREYAGQTLSHEEKTALNNFDRYRLAQLSAQKTERDFHNKYIQLQAMANLSPYQEFLKEIYFNV